MSEQSDEEKTEEPTPQRLEKAKEDGQVARSRELTTLLLLSVGLGALWLLAGPTGGALGGIMQTSMDFSPGVATDTTRLMAQLWRQMLTGVEALLPILAALFLIALIAPTLLGGWLFSAKAIKVDPKRLDPFKGLARVFSSKAVAELAKAIAKSGLTGSVGAVFVYTHLHDILGLADAQGHAGVYRALELVTQCCALMLLAFIFVVLIDVPYQLWSHHKQLRMSPDEIKKEQKENEGDPQLKQRIRSQQQEMASKRMMSEVPGADVVVTNPTHFAVALAYRDAEMQAPRVVAKGADAIAARIRELAADNAVPLLAAPGLARALYRHGELDCEIPAALYAAVAEVLAWVYQLRTAVRDGGRMPDTPTAIEVPRQLDSAQPETTTP